jgi:hypothetical protein
MVLSCVCVVVYRRLCVYVHIIKEFPFLLSLLLCFYCRIHFCGTNVFFFFFFVFNICMSIFFQIWHCVSECACVTKIEQYKLNQKTNICIYIDIYIYIYIYKEILQCFILEKERKNTLPFGIGCCPKTVSKAWYFPAIITSCRSG